MPSSFPRAPWLPFLAVFALAGCDPKLTDASDPGDDGRLPDPVVTPEANAVGNILALHAEILRAGLSVSGPYDTAGARLRGVLAEGCWTLTEIDAGLPKWGLSLEGCTDGHGTTYRGGGEFAPVDGLDGFAFFPWYDTDLIRAVNDSNSDYNHDVHSGSLELGFERDLGTVTRVAVSKYIRHNVHNEIVTFTYDGVHYTGTPGSFGEYPDVDSTARVVWDSVGIFDVDFQAGGQANWSMQGATYQVDVDTGDVSVVGGV